MSRGFTHESTYNESKGGCGAASMLIAYGKKNAQALFDSNLGLALPVSKPTVEGQDGRRFMGVTSNPNENSSPNAEPGRAFNRVRKFKKIKRRVK